MEQGASPPQIDEKNPHYLEFVECFLRGASLQDIYSDSNDGFAVKTRATGEDPAARERRLDACRVQFARTFDHSRNIVEPVARHVPLKDKRVLDFGCGTGALSIAIALEGADVTGVDPTPVSLDAAVARAKYFGCEGHFHAVEVGPAPGRPFPDRSFDVIVLNSVLEFIPHDRELYVLDFLRLLRSGGHLVISTENGLFPIDYYTRCAFPLFRRKTMIERSQPFGTTYFELRRWVRQSPRHVEDISAMNLFNSVDKLAARRQSERANDCRTCSCVPSTASSSPLAAGSVFRRIFFSPTASTFSG